MRTKHLTVAAITLLAVPGLAGCNGGADATPPATNTVSPQASTPATTTSATASATATPTPTPAPPSTTTPTPTGSTSTDPKAAAAQREQEATAVIDAWWPEMVKLYHDPTLPIADMQQYTSGQAKTWTQDVVTTLREDKLHMVGEATWKSHKVVANTEISAGSLVNVTRCLDVSKFRLLDASGKDVTAKDRPNRSLQVFKVTRPKGGATWTISSLQAGGAC